MLFTDDGTSSSLRLCLSTSGWRRCMSDTYRSLCVCMCMYTYMYVTVYCVCVYVCTVFSRVSPHLPLLMILWFTYTCICVIQACWCKRPLPFFVPFITSAHGCILERIRYTYMCMYVTMLCVHVHCTCMYANPPQGSLCTPCSVIIPTCRSSRAAAAQ